MHGDDIPSVPRRFRSHLRFWVYAVYAVYAVLCALLVLAAALRINVIKQRTEQNDSVVENIRFIQITDAHIFDSGKNRDAAGKCQELAENLAALRWAVEETNTINWQHQINPRIPGVSFLAFTGDFGLENIVVPTLKNNPNVHPIKPCEGTNVRDPIGSVDVKDAAKRIADILINLDDKIEILLVPGNNDLVDENPVDLVRYKGFVSQLENRFPNQDRIKDLSAAPIEIKDNSGQYSLSLIGFNTASFKPTKDEKSLVLGRVAGTEASACESVGGLWTKPNIPLGEEPSDAEIKKAKINHYQERHDKLTGLDSQVEKPGDYVIFTHVPDVRDPASDCSDTAPQARYRSSWFLSSDQRSLWNQIVTKENVIAVFAGHFHSDSRDLYSLLKGPEEAQTVNKTYIAPPLSIKYQADKPVTARGLLLVDLNYEHDKSHWVVASGKRNPRDPAMAIGRPVAVWYER